MARERRSQLRNSNIRSRRFHLSQNSRANGRMNRANAKRHLSVEKSFELVASQHESIMNLMKEHAASSRHLSGASSSGGTAAAAAASASTPRRHSSANLRAILEQKREESSMRLTNLDRNTSDFNFDLENVEEQKRQMEFYESLKNQQGQEQQQEQQQQPQPGEGFARLDEHEEYNFEDDEGIELHEDVDEGGDYDSLDIEIAPGVSVPLRSSQETFQAIMEGRIIVTTCIQCNSEMTCPEESNLVICPSCWTCSPVDQSATIAALAEEEDLQLATALRASSLDPHTSDASNDLALPQRGGVLSQSLPANLADLRASIGVNPEDILKWLEENEIQ